MSNTINSLQFRDLALDPATRQLRRGDEVIVLPAKAFDLLLYMVENPGRPLLKAELLSALWPGSFVEEANLSQNVFVIRKILGASVEGAIVTLPGRGYQFAAPVTAVPSSTAEPQSLQATETHVLYEEETEESIPFWRSPMLLAGTAVGLAALVTAGWLGWQRYEDRVSGPPVQVVLADLEGTTGDAVLDRTLTDALRIDLGQSPFVTVVSASTVRRTMTEMMHKADEPLTASLAHDLCERTGSQAVLHGSIARLGTHFLLTEEATNCTDGSSLASAKRVAGSRDALPAAIDTLTATLRHGLGEARRTIARYSVPLLTVNTGSIEALEAYSQSSDLGRRGKLPEAMALLKHAVELDPKFAAAYALLATFAANSADRAGTRVYIQKAYDLRQYANEPVQLQIVSLYANNVTQDLYQALANYEAWASLYPHSPTPWAGLIEVNRELGHHPEAVAAAQHAIALNGTYVVLYYALALEQSENGDLQAARATCDRALSKGMDSDLIHGTLLRIAHLNRDDALFAQQVAWADTHPNAAYVFSGEVAAALVDGRFLEARHLLDRMKLNNQQQGLDSVGITLARDFANVWAELGQTTDAQTALQQGELDPEEVNQLIGLVEIGDTARAKAVLQTELARHPTATLWNKLYGPWVQAQIDYTGHRPKDAIADLEPTRPFSGLGLDMDYLRGLSYLDLNDPALAGQEFRAVLSRPYIDGLGQQIPLSWLNLGRALGRQNRPAEARDAYDHFFKLWAHADPDASLLVQARAEFAALGT
jgi:DNA-binding winged helix-turn-helix (wHTH) protein/tetratricopeptide (TPR) repeat protein